MNMKRTMTKIVIVLGVMIGLVSMSGVAQAQVQKPPVTFIIGDGQTKLDFSQGYWVNLLSLGISTGSIGNSSLRSQSARFPITAGALDRDTVQGEINHTGGLFLQKGAVRVTIVSISIDMTASGAVLSGVVVASSDWDYLNTGNVIGRTELATLTLPPTMDPSQLKEEAFKTLYRQDIQAQLSPALAGLLNSVFSTSKFVQGSDLGTLSFFLVGVPPRDQQSWADFIFRY